MWRLFLSALVKSVRLSRDGGTTNHYPTILPAIRQQLRLSAKVLGCLVLCHPLIWSAALESGPDSPVTVSLSGLVLNAETEAPVQAASIQVVDEGFRERADDRGQFTFYRLPAGTYRLQVSAVGFETAFTGLVVITDYQPRRLVVRLTPSVYSLEDIVVTADRAESALPVVRITRELIQRSQVESVPELLSQVQGLFVQSGGPGSEARVRIRGADPAQVLVLIDGQRINPSGSGVADLSTIPLEIVEEVEIHTGGASAEFGPDAMAGAINIKTRPTTSDSGLSGLLETGVGGWHSRTIRTSISNPISTEKFQSVFSYSRAVADGDFAYEYSVDGVRGQPDTVLYGERQNNNAKSSNFFGTGAYTFSPRAELGYSVQAYESRRGLPGTVENPDSTGEGTDNRSLATLSLQLNKGRASGFETMLGFSSFTEQFSNRDPAIHAANRYDSKFLNEILTLRQTFTQQFWRTLDQRVVLEYRQDRLFHDDMLRPQRGMGRADRSNWGLGWSLSHQAQVGWSGIFERLTTDLSARYDRADTRSERAATVITPAGESHLTEYLSPLMGLALSGTHGITYKLSASYGKSLRLPGMNALFWRGDSRSVGNPDLKPEKSEHSDVSIEVSTTFGYFSMTGSIGYFHSAVTDLVVWQPNFQGAWQPNNVGRALITGHEEALEVAAFQNVITVRYQNSITDAINKLPLHTVEGKRLPFYPRQLSTVSLQARKWGVSVGYFRHFADETYTNQANTRSYSAYAVSDLRLGADLRLTEHWQAGLRCAVNNLTDEHYVLLAQYPMPGRSADISFSIKYGLAGK